MTPAEILRDISSTLLFLVEDFASGEIYSTSELIAAIDPLTKKIDRNLLPDPLDVFDKSLSWLIDELNRQTIIDWQANDAFVSWKLAELQENLESMKINLLLRSISKSIAESEECDENLVADPIPTDVPYDDPLPTYDERLYRQFINWVNKMFPGGNNPKMELRGKPRRLFKFLEKGIWVSYEQISHADIVNGNEKSVQKALQRCNHLIAEFGYQIEINHEGRRAKMTKSKNFSKDK